MINYIGKLGEIAVRKHLGGYQADPRRIAQHIGAQWAIPAVEKAVVTANDAALAVDAGTGAELTASIDQMRSQSLLLMCAARAPSFPLRAGLLQLDEVSPTAEAVDENAPAQIAAKVPSGIVLLTPNKVVFLTPLTLELARSEFAAQAIEMRARDAVSRGLDAQLISTIGSSGGSLGATADALADVRSMIGLINVTGAQPLVIGMAPDVAVRAATLRQGGVLCFPGAVATGQSEIAGLPALATDRVAAEAMLCIDPSGLAINIESIEVGASQNSAILMSDAPNMPANLVSSFQSGMIVVSVTCRFGIAVIRQADVAGELTSIAWANT